jgi:DNA-binding NarL/FixJ family response regulator
MASSEEERRRRRAGSAVGRWRATTAGRPGVTEGQLEVLPPEIIRRPRRLGPRELEVAALIARGYSNAQIAQILPLTSGTIANHVRAIKAKLGVGSRQEVAEWAVERRLRSGEDT